MPTSNFSQQLILVTGATGKQGGAALRRLRAKGFPVRALTRDPGKPAAQELLSTGAEVVAGDLDDAASLERATAGCYGVFSVQDISRGVENEVRQGTALADAAKRAGVSHFVYSSVVSADANTGIPHFDSKWQIEQHIHSIDLPFTILRPVFFMENWENQREQIVAGTLALPLAPETQLQQVAVDDIGDFATLAFEGGEDWLGRTFEIAGDELTMTGTALIFSRLLNRDVSYVQLPYDTFREIAGEELTVMFRWFNDVGYHVDIARLRAEHPGLTTLEAYLRRENWVPQSGMNAYD